MMGSGTQSGRRKPATPIHKARRSSCPAELVLDVLGGKWTTAILLIMMDTPCRYGELRRRAPLISDKVLTTRLRQLEGCGLIARSHGAKGGVGHFYYLTPRGLSLRTIIFDLQRWGEEHSQAFGGADYSFNPRRP